MKRLVILVHGIGTFVGVGRLHILEEPLKKLGFDVQEFSYGFVLLFGALLKDDKLGKELAAKIYDGYLAGYDEVHVIGHSNGCSIMEKASTYIRTCDSYTYVAPALQSGNAPENVVKRVNVWFNPKDGVLKLTEFLRHIPEFLFQRVEWGKQGVTGYVGADPRIKNFEITGYGLSPLKQHSAFFFNQHIYVPRIIEAIK